MSEIIAIVQARVGSSRLPEKVILPLNGKPSIYWVMNRTMACRDISQVYLATSVLSENDVLAEIAENYKWNLFRGSEEDVLSRFETITKEIKPDIVVRVCADNFAIDPNVISLTIQALKTKKLDIVNPFLNHSYPFGAGAEVARGDTVIKLADTTKGMEMKYREHIFSYAYEHKELYRYTGLTAPASLDRPDITISVDSESDYSLMEKIYSRLNGKELTFTTQNIVTIWDSLLTQN